MKKKNIYLIFDSEVFSGKYVVDCCSAVEISFIDVVGSSGLIVLMELSDCLVVDSITGGLGLFDIDTWNEKTDWEVVVADVVACVDGDELVVVRAAGFIVVVTPWIKLGTVGVICWVEGNVDSINKWVSSVGEKLAIAVVIWLFGVAGSLAIKKYINRQIKS